MNPIKDIIEGLTGQVTKVVGDLADNRIQKGTAVVQLTTAIQAAAAQAEQAASAAIVAEAQGESWLQRSWRPIGSLSLLGLLLSFPGLFALGYDVSRLAAALEQVPDRMYWLVAGCFGGYTALRSLVDKQAAIPGLAALQSVLVRKKNR